jgi:REP element-mobilizing transposase RayT
MSTFTQIIYQIVFSTKHRDHTLKGLEERVSLYKYIYGILKNHKCKLYQINGVENHIHIATHIHPEVPISTLVKTIKVSTSHWIKQHNLFPDFIGWAQGYGAFTYTIKEKSALIRYIEKQESHHSIITFEKEFRGLLREHGIDYEERFLFSHRG